jgi:hypothetical protein
MELFHKCILETKLPKVIFQNKIGFRLEAKPSARLVGALENTYRTIFALDVLATQMFYFALV